METGTIDIRMLAIDLDSIEDVEQIDEAVQFRVKLSGTPARDWLNEFEYLYRTVHHPIKPPVVVDGDTLQIQFLPRYDEDLQPLLDFIGDICCRASEEAHLTVSIRTTDEKEARKREFRKYLATMHIPDC